MCRSRWLHLVVFVSALAHGGCGAGGGTLTGAGGNTGMGTGSGGLGTVPDPNCGAAPGTARLLPPDIIIALDASSGAAVGQDSACDRVTFTMCSA